MANTNIKNNAKNNQNAKNNNNNNNAKEELSFVMDKKEVIEKNIDSLNTTLKDAQKSLHVLACQCLYHHFEHGDTTLMVRLVNGLPKSIRKADLLHWIIDFGAFDYDVKNGLTHSKEKMANLKKDYIKQVNKAYNNPFFEYTKDKEVIKKSFVDMLKELEKKIVYDMEHRKESRFTASDLSDIRSLIKAREGK